MSGEKIRILVVDDELGIREGCRSVLEMEGFEVDTGEDGIVGWELFKKRGNYAVALIDMMMPGIGGLELVQKIAEVDRDIVLFVITAYSTIETAVDATKKGAFGYISKPFTPDELLLPIRRGLENRALSLETKRLRAERENSLLEVAFERSKSNTIIKCMKDGVLVVNRERQAVLWNAAAHRIVTTKNDLMPPVPLSDLTIPPDLSASIDEVLGDSKEPTIISKEIAIGSKVYIADISPVIDPEVGASGAVVVFSDISEVKKLEDAKSTFVGMVAHEMKRPLGAINGYLNLFVNGQVGDLTEKQMEIISRAYERGMALQTMVSEFMNITAMKTGKFNLKRIPASLCPIVKTVVESAMEKAGEKNIELRFESRDFENDRALADEAAMRTIFANLIDNAIKYSPDNSRVRVEVEDAGKFIKVSVSDTGIGLNDEERERIFEEFYRASNEFTEKIPGTGLGLSLVKRLVDLHNGKATVESAPGKGSVFAVFIPKLE